MIKYVKSSCCDTVLDREGLCECETMYVSIHSKCPECGSHTYCYNDPGMDSSMSDWCTNADCNFTQNQFLSWEEIKEFNYNK